MADDIYTITRLADELQKTRQNVRRRIKKLDIKALKRRYKSMSNGTSSVRTK